jgi:hypothetical protein
MRRSTTTTRSRSSRGTSGSRRSATTGALVYEPDSNFNKLVSRANVEA